MKFLKYILICLIATVLLLTPIGQSTVFAQDEPSIIYDNVRLWVNPEYDDSRLLVMMQGQVEGFQAPITVRFLVPYAAEMYSAGSIDSTGKYSGGPPERKPSSVFGWDEISYTLQTDTFRVEYYDPIIIGKPDKTISYEFRSINPISKLAVIIQQPRRASDFKVTPAGVNGQDSEGFDIYTYTYSNLDTQLPLQFVISYTDKESLFNSLIVISVTIFVVIGITGLLWWRSRASPKNRAQRRRLTRAKVRGTSIGMVKPQSVPAKSENIPRNIPTKIIVCPECGEEIGTEKFCPVCGANRS